MAPSPGFSSSTNHANKPVPPLQSGLGDVPQNIAAALCYFMVVFTGIFFLMVDPYNRVKIIRFHAYQSIFFSMAWILILTILVTFCTILAYIPILGSIGLAALIFHFFSGLVLWFLLMWRAYNNQRLVLPFIGPFAEKQA